jgi:selenide,water dikinase
MLQGQQDAARILADHGAIACTDVTGFGLAGHLLNLLRGRDLGVALDLASLPVLDGAIATLRQGWFSSLHHRNAEVDAQMDYGGDRPESRWQDPRWQLLFDPQTAGGLLAVVPGDRAAACGDRLRAHGYKDARQIGVVQSLRVDDDRVIVGCAATPNVP